MDLSSHGIVALVRNRAGEYLLLEDARDLMKGKWAPPHGRCEASDTSEEAAVIREVQEETGLTVKPIIKLYTQAADTKVKTVSFWLVESEGEEDVVLDAESSRYAWATVDDALKMPLYPGTQAFFKNIKSGEVAIV